MIQIVRQLKFGADCLPKRVRVGITMLALGSGTVLIVSALPYLSASIPASFVFPIQFLASVLGAVACLGSVALTLLVTGRRNRLLYICLALTFPLTFAATLWAARYHVDLRREWFLREGIKQYEDIAAIVRTNMSALSDEPRFLRGFGKIAVSARTNKDGSLTIWFKPRDENPRLGYLYDSRHYLGADPLNNKNPHFLWLTNGWYEF